MSALGALVLLAPTGAGPTAGATLGNALVLGNCLSYALYLVLQRPILNELPPLTVVAWTFVFGGAATLLVSAPALVAAPLATVPARVWLGIAYTVLIPTAVNYAINTWAVRRSSPALVAAYTTLQPVVAAALGVLVLGEVPGWRDGLGFVLILAGLAAVASAAPARPVRAR